MSLSIADQVRMTLQVQNRVAAAWGAVLGAIPPLAAFSFSHFGFTLDTWRGWLAAVFVLACLLFSAPKVYKWSAAAFSASQWPRAEAVGFVVLLEGAMTLADHSVPVLAVVSYVCLAVLVCINAVVTAVSLALDQKATRAAARESHEARNPDTLSLVPAPVTKRPARRIQAKAVRR